MDNEAIRIAFKALYDHVKKLEDDYRSGDGGYEMISVRMVLRKLEYSNDEADQVIRAIADAGFDYCIDRTIPVNGFARDATAADTPSQDVCYWGMDQLRSRLDSVAWEFTAR